MEEKNKLIEQETRALLEQVGINADVTGEDGEEGYRVTIGTDENGLLIGKHGSTLSALELILAMIMHKKTGEFKRVIIEVGDYRKEREEYLKNLASRLREEVIATGQEKTIRGLKPWERRLVHMEFADDAEVLTESSGDERERILAIKRK